MQAFSISSLSQARRWAATALLAGVATGAMAQTATPAAVAPVAAPQSQVAASAQRLNIGQIYTLLTKAGYHDVQEIEWSDGRYEAKARNAEGARVKLELDGHTGAVLRSRIKH